MTRKASAILAIVLLAVPAQGSSVGVLQIFGDISDEEEIRVGRDAARQVERQSRILRDRRINRYIDGLGQRLARLSDRPDIPYSFKVIESDEVNAFALPGGYLYVYTGLLELTENESELAGILGHEIAHVSERHHVDQIKKAQGIGLGLGILDLVLGRSRNTAENLGAIGAQLFAQGVFFKFSRDAEREADREAVELLRRAGIRPQGMLSLFEKMESLSRSRPNLFGDFFSSHPKLSERQDNIQGMLHNSDYRLSQDSAEFQRMRRRLR